MSTHKTVRLTHCENSTREQTDADLYCTEQDQQGQTEQRTVKQRTEQQDTEDKAQNNAIMQRT